MITRGTLQVNDDLFEINLYTQSVRAHSILTPYEKLIHDKFQDCLREIERGIKSELANRNSRAT